MAAEQVTPAILGRLARLLKIALGVNVTLTVFNVAVLYALVVYVVAEPATVEGVDPFDEEDEAAAAKKEKGDPRKEMREFFDRMSDLLDRAARKHGTNPADVLPAQTDVDAAVESRTMHSDEAQTVMEKYREGFDYYDLAWPSVIPER